MENQSTQIFHLLKNYAHLMITLYLHNLHLITPTQKFTPAYFKTTHLKDYPDFFFVFRYVPVVEHIQNKDHIHNKNAPVYPHPFTHSQI